MSTISECEVKSVTDLDIIPVRLLTDKVDAFILCCLNKWKSYDSADAVLGDAMSIVLDEAAIMSKINLLLSVGVSENDFVHSKKQVIKFSLQQQNRLRGQ
jgi:hypothetical protein